MDRNLLAFACLLPGHSIPSLCYGNPFGDLLLMFMPFIKKDNFVCHISFAGTDMELQLFTASAA